MPYRRVLLKLSGEALMGEQSYGIDPSVIQRIAAEIAGVVAQGRRWPLWWEGAISSGD